MCGIVRNHEKTERDRAEAMQAQQRYGDFAWGLPDEPVDDLDAEDEVEQEQVSDGD